MTFDAQLVADHVLVIQQLALRAQAGDSIDAELGAAIDDARAAFLAAAATGRSSGDLDAYSRRLRIMASLVDHEQGNYRATLLGAANRI